MASRTSPMRDCQNIFIIVKTVVKSRVISSSIHNRIKSFLFYLVSCKSSSSVIFNYIAYEHFLNPFWAKPFYHSPILFIAP